MKISLLFTFTIAACSAQDLGFGGLFPRDGHNPTVPEESPVEAQETIVDNPDFEPPEETTIVEPPMTTVDPQGTTIYYCIPTSTETPVVVQETTEPPVHYSTEVGTVDGQEVTTVWYTTESVDAQGTTTEYATWMTVDVQETWPAETTVIDYKTVYYCPPRPTETEVVVEEVSSTIYYTKTTDTIDVQETTTEPPEHVCELTTTVDVQSTDTCEHSVQTIKMDVYKTIYVSSCVVTEQVEVQETTIEETPEPTPWYPPWF